MATTVEELGELVLIHTNGTCWSKLMDNAQYGTEHDPVLDPMMAVIPSP